MEEGWERPPRVELALGDVNRLIQPAFPGRRVSQLAVIPTGLANTNIRFSLEGGDRTYVLRLYTRDADAARRELELISYLAAPTGSGIPLAPLVYACIDIGAEHRYSIWQFVEGQLLQDLFKTLSAAELASIASECGKVLASIAKHRFEKCGELGPGLEIAHEYGRPSELVPNAVHRALFEGRAGQRLGAPLRDDLWRAVERTAPLLRAIDDRYALVHADYKRSNILMQRAGASWKVGAVLDWEFAFAGPPLIDIGLFLRAGRALPQGFREAFTSSYAAAGGELPADWLPLSRLVDVLSQVTFLDDPRERPHVFAETTAVVRETIELLS
jgi:aminoglycoside phosphotransferase (APT) family kinase protein